MDMDLITTTTTTTTTELLTGTKDFIVGISPTYWSHVKLLIEQVHNLDYINGINFLVIQKQQQRDQQREQYKDFSGEIPSSNDTIILPISKCCLQGCLVGIESKGGGCYSLILDDGTGLIDVRYYDNRSSDNEYSLPSLTEPLFINNDGTNSKNTTTWMEIGSLVQIFGRINCWNADTIDTNFHVVREIIATVILPIPTNRRSCPYSMDAESYFWSEWRQSMQQVYNKNDKYNNEYYHETTTIAGTKIIPTSIGLTNAITTLQWLGNDITSQVMKRQHLPAVDDSIGEWRLFGTNCTCGGKTSWHHRVSLSNNHTLHGKLQSTNSMRAIIKEKLLYCHCIATPEVYDPNFIFRDNLLLKLITMECDVNESTLQPVDVIENEQFNNEGDEEEFLRFHYKDDIVNDNNLHSIATQQIVKAGITPSSMSFEKIMMKTMIALRRDGIIVLLDTQSDVYALISYKNVLVPYVRMIRKLEHGIFDDDNDIDDDSEINNNDEAINNNVKVRKERPLERVLYSKEHLPPLLAQVPSARFELVERCLLHEQKRKIAGTLTNTL